MADLSDEILRGKLESFLTRACEAESKKDFVEAERLFMLAMYCDGRIRLDITDAKKYVAQAGPLYKPSTVVVGAEVVRSLS